MPVSHRAVSAPAIDTAGASLDCTFASRSRGRATATAGADGARAATAAACVGVSVGSLGADRPNETCHDGTSNSSPGAAAAQTIAADSTQ